MRLALSMIVRGTKDEAELLDRCLSSIAPYVDGIFLTLTHKKGEQVHSDCYAVAMKYKAKTFKFEWINDFAAARNFALAQVPNEFDYWCWFDGDDYVRGADKLRATIEEHPAVDVFALEYLYAFDEQKQPIVVHWKSRILKHDGCTEWVGALHEDFKSNRNLETFAVKGINVLHLTDDTRTARSAERNVEVATSDFDRKPEDPRSYWNLGNALKAAGRTDEAVMALQSFMERSSSDEEKYIVRLRLAECRLAQGKENQALEEDRSAIGIRPGYPDAYHLCGQILYGLKRYTEARDMFLQGLLMKPPTQSIIVFNPRAYDYEPLMALARTYVQLSLPSMALVCLKAVAKIRPEDKTLEVTIAALEKESKRFEKVTKLIGKLQNEKEDIVLAAALKKIPKDLQSHPAICNLRNTRFIKKESSGKDLVYYCGFTEEEWTPETARKNGIGGSEEAVIHLSKEFVKHGWNVTVYNNCGHKEQVFDGVTYKPFWTWNYRDKQDITIVWRNFKPVDYGINSDKVFVDLHDVIPPGELNEARIKVVNKVFVKSAYHRGLFPHVPDEKFAIVPNGIIVEDFQDTITRDPMLLVNTSSPDRSLTALLECFEEVKKQVPDAKLVHMYGWGVFDKVHSGDAKMMDWKRSIEARAASIPGVTMLGRVNHKEVAEWMQKANIFAYPTAFAEISCISAMKAQAAGATPITTDFAALNETVQFGIKVKTNPSLENWGKDYAFDFSLQEPEARKFWIDACVDHLKRPMNEEKRNEMRSFSKIWEWEKIAKAWLSIIAVS